MNQFKPSAPKHEKILTGVTFSSKRLKKDVQDRAKMLGLSMSEYICVVLRKSLAKDPRKQVEKMNDVV